MTMNSHKAGFEDLPLCNFNTLQALEAEVGSDVLPTLISSLCEEIEASLSNFKTYLNKNAWQSLEIEAHALKSAALSFGAERLSQICRKIELSAKNKTGFQDIEILINDFEHHAKDLLDKLKTLSE